MSCLKKTKTTFEYSQEEILRNYRNTEKMKKQRNAPIEKISEIKKKPFKEFCLMNLLCTCK